MNLQMLVLFEAKRTNKKTIIFNVGSFVGSNGIACDGSRQPLLKNQQGNPPNSKGFKGNNRGILVLFLSSIDL